MWGKVILGGFFIGLHWFTFFYAIKIAGVSLTLSMMASGALITALIDPLLNGRKILKRKIKIPLIQKFHGVLGQLH